MLKSSSSIFFFCSLSLPVVGNAIVEIFLMYGFCEVSLHVLSDDEDDPFITRHGAYLMASAQSAVKGGT